MSLVGNMAACILAALVTIPGAVFAAPDASEIDLKELGPAGGRIKQQPVRPPSPASTEIDLKELRRSAPPRPAQQPQRKASSHAAAPETAARTPGHESFHQVQPGEHLFQILMKRYGLSNQAAERLIPEVMRLNGITSPKGIRVGQRLRIPLPARDRSQTVSTPAADSRSRQQREPAPAAAANQAAQPPAATGITIAAAPPCRFARNILEKLGLLAASPANIQGGESVSAEYAGQSVAVVCGLSGAEQYTYKRLLGRSNIQLLPFDGGESAERTLEKLANALGLVFHKKDSDAGALPLTYILAAFGAWPQGVELTVTPGQSDPVDPPTHTIPP